MGPFRIITKPGCQWSEKAKSLLKCRGLPFSEDIRDTPADIASFKAAYRSFPQVFVGEKRIGGYEHLKSYLSARDDDFD